MICEQLNSTTWRLSFSESEAGFIINILARLARHYLQDPDEMPPALRAYWQGSIASPQQPLTSELRESQEMLSDSRAELRSERLNLAEKWIREFEISENRDPWRVEISSEERDEFVAMLNDRRVTLALEMNISHTDMEADPSHIAEKTRRSAILEIDVLGHFILVALGPQIYRP